VNVVIDGDVVTHRKMVLGLERHRTAAWMSHTLCRVWFVEREHPLEAEGLVPKGDPRSRRTEGPVDCMICLVREAEL